MRIFLALRQFSLVTRMSTSDICLSPELPYTDNSRASPFSRTVFIFCRFSTFRTLGHCFSETGIPGYVHHKSIPEAVRDIRWQILKKFQLFQVIVNQGCNSMLYRPELQNISSQSIVSARAFSLTISSALNESRLSPINSFSSSLIFRSSLIYQTCCFVWYTW